MSEDDVLRAAYDPSRRCAECADEDAMLIEGIEFAAAIPVFVTQDQQRRLHDLLCEIVSAPCNQPQEGVHWLSAYGSKPKWSLADHLAFGVPIEPGAKASGEPEFDDSIFHLATCSREFVSGEERERKIQQRAKENHGKDSSNDLETE